MSGKGQKLWFAVLPIIAVAAFFILSNVFSYGVYILFSNILRVPANQFVNFSYLAEMLVGVILIILFFIANKAIFREDTSEMRTAPNSKMALMSLVLGAGGAGVAYLWISLAEKIPVFSESLAAMNKANSEIGGGSPVGVVLMAVVIAPLLEELIFRGLVFRSIEKIKTGWIPVLISAVIFGAYHMNLVQAVYATGMGMIAAIVYAKTKNLMYPILVHFANNLISAIQSFIPSKTGVMAIDIFTVIMIIPMCYVIYRMLAPKDDQRMKQNANI